jgi:hypothetical protein
MGDPIAQTYGDLSLTFIGGDAIRLAWLDKGSGGICDGAFYNPDFDMLRRQYGSFYDDYYFLGSYGRSNYRPPEGPMLLVTDIGTQGALRPADDFELIWTDRGSGAKMDGSFWRPICRDDKSYVPLGIVCVRGHAKPDPGRLRVALVRTGLTVHGKVGDRVWYDKLTGAKTDFSAWSTAVPDGVASEDDILIAPGGFTAVASHSKPATARENRVLKLPVTIVSKKFAAPPDLTTPEQPPASTVVASETVTVPFTAVRDPGLAWSDRIADSPFYTISRDDVFNRERYYENNSPRADTQKITTLVGREESETETFEKELGLGASVTAGMSYMGASASATGSVDFRLRWHTSTTTKTVSETTVEKNCSVSPYAAVAVWTRAARITVRRYDQTRVGPQPQYRVPDSWWEKEIPLVAAKPDRSRRHHAPA